jgi:hypothetical protein
MKTDFIVKNIFILILKESSMKKPSKKAAYRNLPRFLWKEGEFSPLSDDSKLVYLFLLSHPDLTAIGTLTLSPSELA